MKSQKIEKIRKKFHREWLLIEVDRMDHTITKPISGYLIAHSPNRDEIYKKMMTYKSKRLIAVDYSEDSLPKGTAVAF